MFHAGGHKGATRGRSSGFSRHYPGLLSHHDWKQPLRCGILFCTFSCVLFMIGVILTWLGVHDVFGESVPITGPILLAVGGLMLLLAFRQFYIARQRQVAASKLLATKDAVKLANASLNENEDDDAEMSGYRDGHVKFKDVDGEMGENSDPYGKSHRLFADRYYSSHKNNTSMDESSGGATGNGLTCGSYVWPPASLHSPYYSMALMANSANYAYAPLTYATSPKTDELPTLPHGSAFVQLPTSDGSILLSPGAASQVSSGASPTNLGPSGQGTDDSPQQVSSPSNDSAILQTSSTTLHTQTAVPEHQALSTSAAAAAAAPSSSVASEDVEPIPESHKIFPSDYLFSHQRTASGRTRKDTTSGSSASAGISNLPKQTTVMMLRTLELQETI